MHKDKRLPRHHATRHAFALAATASSMAPIEQSETIHKLYDDQRVDELSFGTCGRFVNLHQAVLQAELPMTRSRLLAKLYADSQHPIVLHHAERVTLHPYFARWGEGDWLHVPMPLALITARMADMAMLLNEHGRDDFKVEKDKCEMYRWFARNRLPFAQVLGMWSSLPELYSELQSAGGAGSVFTRNSSGWPVLVKACHMTQGEARSVKLLSSQTFVESSKRELQAWLLKFWRQKADDQHRAWTENSNALTDVLSPGFMLQSAVRSWAPVVGEGNSAEKQVIELKVEVFWGRAYMATENSFHIFFVREPEADGGGVKKGGKHHAIEEEDSGFSGTFGRLKDLAGLRDSKDTLCVARNGTMLPLRRNSWWHTIYHGGYLRCAWDLAERTARAMAIDSVRIDIFLSPGEPSGCTLNEISLSSAMVYDAHGAHFPRMWLEPHLRRSYSLLETSKRVYMLNGSESVATRTPALKLERTWWWWCGPCPGNSVAFFGGKPGTDCSLPNKKDSSECFACSDKFYACGPALDAPTATPIDHLMSR